MKQQFVRIGLTALSSLLALSAAQAQALPNGTLETWETRAISLAPAGWFTFDDVLASSGFPLAAGTTTRSTDKHAGTYAARLESKTNTLLDVTFPGVLGLGTSPNIDADFPGGIPFTSRPASMQFYYKLTVPATSADAAGAQVVLTKWDGARSNVVAGGVIQLAPTSSYTLSTVPLQYQSSVAPDSIRILFVTGTQSTPTAGTVLFIDDVVMTGTATPTVDAARNAAVTVYPNPSADGLFTLSTTREASWTGAAYTVSDVTGRTVLQQPAAPANATGPRTVDLRGQRAGVYTLRLNTPEGPVVHKLLIP
ncbi:T9SS type A sorting domain-containing protein [Hymenobacter metallicola]|nr:T9SS type A sorting domain-containing protein [Hymenobacter metallicola]